MFFFAEAFPTLNEDQHTVLRLLKFQARRAEKETTFEHKKKEDDIEEEEEDEASKYGQTLN